MEPTTRKPVKVKDLVKGRTSSVIGLIRLSGGCLTQGIEIEAAAVEQDGDAEVHKAAIAKGSLLEHLDGVDRLAAGVGDV